MLTEMRKVTRGWFALALLGLLGIAFAIWGINDVFSPVTARTVVTGNGVSVSNQEFRQAFDNELKNFEAQGQQVTQAQALEANIHHQVLDRLATQSAIERLAIRAGIGVDDAMVADAIRNDQSFKNPLTGAFDRSTYQRILAEAGYSPATYQRTLRASFARRQLAQTAIAGLRAPTSFGQLIHAFDMEKRVVSIAAITPQRVGPPPTPTPAEIEQFYKENGQIFALPEYRAFTIVSVSPSDFQARVTIDEAAFERQYAQQKDLASVPEKRTFVQLSGAPDRGKAEEAARRLAAGENPEKIAADLSMQAQTLTDKSRQDVPDAKVAGAVFALASQGAVTGAVDGLSWSAARLISIQAAQTGDSAAARAQMRADFIKDAAINAMNDAIESFEDKRNAGGDIALLAGEAGFRVAETGLIDQRGLTQSRTPAPEFVDNPAFLRRAFETVEGEIGDFASDGADGYQMVRLDKIQASGPPPLDSVREQVGLAWRAQKTGQAMRAIGDALTASVKAGTSFAEAARAQKAQIVTASQQVDRSFGQNSPSPQLANELFSIAEGATAVGAGGPSGAVLFVGIVEKIIRADPTTDPTGVEQRRQAAENLLNNDMLESMSRAARRVTKTRVNTQLADQLLGKQPPVDEPADEKAP
jgi:peptidyl-prolyl cis-trans isomerase D